MNRRRLWNGFKRGAASAAVLAIVIGLPILGLWQLKADGALVKTNKATPLPAFKQRSVDSDKAPQLFDEPLISVTFDDGWESTYSVAAPLLLKAGIHSTQYLISGVIDDPAYLSLDQVKALEDHGQQIACHTVSHADLTTLKSAKLDYELGGCKQFFNKKGFGYPLDFAAPYGSTNPAVSKAIAKYFRSERNTNGDISNGVTDVDINLASNFDPHDIIGVTVHSDTTVEQMQAAVEYASQHNGWLVFTYHQADDQAGHKDKDGHHGSKFGMDASGLKKQLDYLSSTPVRIVTIGQVMDSLEVQ